MKTMHKWYWMWEFEEEEQWLAEMARSGQALTAVGFCRYDFEDCAPGEYEVRLQRLEQPVRRKESQEYITFVEETGAEYLGTVNQWVYFRKRREDGPFELFSDTPSRVKHLDTILWIMLPLLFLNLAAGMQNLMMFVTMNTGANLFGLVNLALAGLLAYGIGRLWRRRKRLRRDAELFEE